MKKLALFIAFFGLVGFETHAARAVGGSTSVLVSIADALVPSGFDSDSDVFVVVSGMFPNGCYRWGHAEVASKEPNYHEVRTYAKVQTGGPCLTVLMPYTHEVKLGKLPAGKHSIRFMNGDGVTWLERSLVVE